jgi:small subunit ribosomal protein S6
MVRDYETVIIFDPSLDESGYEQQIQTFTQIVEQEGGRISGLDKWGKRQLAYQIRKKDDGYYAVIRYQCNPSAVRELERRLRLNEFVLRQMTVVDEGAKIRAEKQEAQQPPEPEEKPSQAPAGDASDATASPEEG